MTTKGSIVEADESQEDSMKPGDYIAKLRRSSRNRESYDEIAELEAELRRAYIATELRMQLVERETERYVENVRKQREAKVMRLTQQEVLENNVREKSVNLKQSEDYRKELTEQMKRKEEERCIMMEEARREREILTEIDRIREQCERFKAMARKSEMVESVRRERLIFQEMKEIRRLEELEAEARKDYEDEEYLKRIDQRAHEARKLYEAQLRKREETVQEIAKVLVNMENEKKEREILLDELITEDVKFELMIREEEERIRKEKMREELAGNLKEQMVFTEECKLRFVERDRAFAEEIMRKIIEDEKTARLTAQARRRMQSQYREDLARLIQIRCKIREDEMARMQLDAQEESARREEELHRIKEDRKRLLQQHAPNVAGFIDKSKLTEDEQKIVEELS